VQNVRVIGHEVACPVAVMGIRVQDGHAADALDPSCLPEGDDHVIVAAIAPEEVPPGMMAAGPDETEGVG
jgi:hypothetical protein